MRLRYLLPLAVLVLRSSGNDWYGDVEIYGEQANEANQIIESVLHVVHGSVRLCRAEVPRSSALSGGKRHSPGEPQPARSRTARLPKRKSRSCGEGLAA